MAVEPMHELRTDEVSQEEAARFHIEQPGRVTGTVRLDEVIKDDSSRGISAGDLPPSSVPRQRVCTNSLRHSLRVPGARPSCAEKRPSRLPTTGSVPARFALLPRRSRRVSGVAWLRSGTAGSCNLARSGPILPLPYYMYAIEHKWCCALFILLLNIAVAVATVQGLRRRTGCRNNRPGRFVWNSRRSWHSPRNVFGPGNCPPVFLPTFGRATVTGTAAPSVIKSSVLLSDNTSSRSRSSGG